MLRLFRVAFLGVLIGFFASAKGQHLTITNLLNLPPVVFDTIPYNIAIDVLNTDSGNTFSDTLDVFIRSMNTGITQPLYLGIGPDSIGPGDTITRVSNGFMFNANSFSAGDNIVVIWPAARMIPVAGDSIVTMVNVNFTSGIDDFDKDPVTIYPNPSADFLYIRGLHEKQVKRVRILDIAGRLCFEVNTDQKLIPVKQLSPGIYLINVELQDGRRRSISFVKG